MDGITHIKIAILIIQAGGLVISSDKREKCQKFNQAETTRLSQ
jgi:hypothetical protein